LRISLGNRFALLVVAVLVSVLGSVSYLLVLSQRDKFLEVMGGASAIGADLLALELERTMARSPDDPLAELDQILREGAGTGPTRRLLLIDQDARIVRAPAGGGTPGEQLPPFYRELVREAGKSNRAIGRQAGDGIGFVTVRALHNGASCVGCHETETGPLGYLAMDVSLATAWDFVRGQAGVMVMATALAAVLISILLYVVARIWVIQPINRLREALTAVEVGLNDVQVDDRRGVPELRRVAVAFNAMSDRLSAARRAVEHAHVGEHVAANQALSLNTLASVLAHELRNPMSGISMALGTLARGLPQEHPDQDVIRQAQHQLARVNRELDDLLAYARPPRTETRAEIDMGLLARRTAAFSRPTARSLGVELDVSVDVAQPSWVHAEVDRLEQVLLNLIQNAIHSVSESGRAGGRVLVAVGGDRPDRVCICVEDDGPGIADELRERIFEPFYTTRKQGTGLGLPLARRIVEYHGGHLRVERSVELGGARFIVCLPRIEAPA
jgi:signal transduction histidine kinase